MVSSHDVPRRRFLAGALTLPALAVANAARAQAWRPTHAVRIVVPAEPGGTTDIMARLMARHLQERWSQTVVVDNRSGGGGVIGSTEVARATPDGHTLLMGNIGPQSIAYSLYRNMPYGPQQFIPVSNVITAPNVLVVNPAVPARTVADFVAWLKANPGKPYASSGTAQSPHLSAVWFLQLTGTQGTHVPYRGAAPALNGLMAGDTSFFFDNATTAMAFVRAGKLNALAFTSAERSPYEPGLPTLRETLPELGDYDVSTWVGVFVPAGTPRPAVDELNGRIKELLGQDDARKYFAQLVGLPAYGSPEQFAAFVAREIVKWRGVIEREGLKMDAN
jgi:tripartite-type tricarboxylate transporter receptor subunit TctC